jgi:peroxiredoxin
MTKRIVLIVALFVSLGLWFFYTNRFEVNVPEIIGAKAPDFTATTLDGQSVNLSELIGQKAVLVNFWATWCAPCQEEIPILNIIYEGLKGSDVEIISLMEDDVSTDDDRKQALDRFKAKRPVNFPVYMDRDQMIADLYQTYKIPESFIIDKKGVVVEKISGPIEPSAKNRVIGTLRELAAR